jgi:thiosulfate/3-mercaptopyruvate sulfurtransferase
MLIDADRLAGFRSDPATILVGFMPEQDFAKDHIPGSVQLDWPVLEVTDTSDESIAHWREQISQTLASLGITRDRPVAAYDAGTLFAARLWWILHYLGHEDNHVVNGGLAAWQQTAHETTTGATPAAVAANPAAKSFQVTPRADVLAQLDEVRARLDDPGVAIVDARTPEEYTAGHIPGAVNINYPRNAVTETPLFWKPADELRAMYEEAGITPDKRVIPYCSTGVRSAVTFFTLRLIGYQNVGLYTGSGINRRRGNSLTRVQQFPTPEGERLGLLHGVHQFEMHRLMTGAGSRPRSGAWRRPRQSPSRRWRGARHRRGTAGKGCAPESFR